MKCLVPGLALVLALAAPAWADFDDGLAAWDRGDYETALVEFRRLAEHGHGAAQRHLGHMYESGRGPPRDLVQAYKWYDLAAARLWEEAWRPGRTDRDRDASIRAAKAAAGDRDEVIKSLTAADVARAQRLARAWLADHRPTD